MAIKLSEKQLAKVTELIASINLAGIATGLDVAAKAPSAERLKILRKDIAKQLHVVDKALAVYEIDLALDEAAALIAKKTAD